MTATAASWDFAIDPHPVIMRPSYPSPNNCDLRRVIDFTRPVGALFVAVLHFVRDEEDPWETSRFSWSDGSRQLPRAVARHQRRQRPGPRCARYRTRTKTLPRRPCSETNAIQGGSSTASRLYIPALPTCPNGILASSLSRHPACGSSAVSARKQTDANANTRRREPARLGLRWLVRRPRCAVSDRAPARTAESGWTARYRRSPWRRPAM